MWMSMQGIKFRDFMSIFVGTSNRNGSLAIPNRTRAIIIVLRLNLCQCQSGCNVVMVKRKCIKSQLSYFIVGQGKECTYVYFHILYDFSYVSRHYVNILSITLKFF